MSIKEVWQGLIGKSDKTELISAEEKHDIQQIANMDLFPIVRIPETSLQKYKKIPLAELSTLGSAFSQLQPGVRTIAQTKKTTIGSNNDLYVGIRPNVAGQLKMNGNTTYGNIMKVNSQGKNVINGRMSFRKIDNLPATETTSFTLPIDPTLMVAAVAIMAIEQKLGKIQESVEEVLQFLELDKQAAQRGNLKQLAEIAEDYKMYCEDNTFCDNKNIIVGSIQNEAFKNIEFYKEKISSELQKKKSVHLSTDADSLMNSVIREFAEYQLSCYLYSYCTFMDTMLRKDFSTEHIERSREKMLLLSKEYNALFSECYSQIEKYQNASVDAKITDGVGVALKGLGKAVGTIPIAKDKKFDETLINAGNKLDDKKSLFIKAKLETVKAFEDNRMDAFSDNLSSIDLLYNGENSMLTDGENIYMLQAK